MSETQTTALETYFAARRAFRVFAPASAAGDRLWALQNALRAGDPGRIHSAVLMLEGYANRNYVPAAVTAETVAAARLALA